MRCLLDTSSYSAFRRSHPLIPAHLAKADRVYLSPTVVGELREGFLAGGQVDKNEGLLSEFLAQPMVGVLRVNLETSRRYAQIAHYLREEGTPVGDNDLWIAATAFQYGLRLVTTDKHFQRIPLVSLDLFAA